jgi:hypothetical protein
MLLGGFASTRRVFEDWANDVVATTTPTASVDSNTMSFITYLLLRAANGNLERESITAVWGA